MSQKILKTTQLKKLKTLFDEMGLQYKERPDNDGGISIDVGQSKCYLKSEGVSDKVFDYQRFVFSFNKNGQLDFVYNWQR